MSVKTRVSRTFVTDPWLVGVSFALLSIGVVMLASASLGLAQQAEQSPFYYVVRQSLYGLIGVFAALFVVRIKMSVWQKMANPLMVIGVVLLIAVLIPGIGKEANGSYRWIDLGAFNLQVSELVKLFMIIYFSAFLVKKANDINMSLANLAKSLVPLLLVSILLILEPDLGATAVIVGTVIGLFFIAGIRLSYFLTLLVTALIGLAGLIFFASYRLERFMTFMQACDPAYYHNKGYQLCQALIAFGRGEWVGVGLGSGIQKEFYLPEAHTDFLLAILGEELGAVGTLVVVVLFAVLFYRAFSIAKRAEQSQQVFSAFVAYGIAFWIGLQSLVNIGVNMGLLPTKGITLPLVSYGGSSIVVTCIAIAILLRISYEATPVSSVKTKGGAQWQARAS